MTQCREARNIRPNGTRHGSPPSKKSSYKLSGTRSSRPITSTSDAPRAANSQTPRVLDDAVATEDGVDVPQHVGGSQVPACPHRKSSSGHKKWAATSPSCEDDTHTDTASSLKTYLKRKAAAHQEGLPKRNHFWTKIIRTAGRLYT